MTQDRPSGAAIGWTAFASFMMLLLGVWWAIAGFAGILKDDIFVATPKYLFKFNVQTWGWIHLLLGIVVFLGGLALFRGDVWARTLGVILAAISGLIGFAWLPYYPVWGFILIAVSIFVIWALTVHGRDIVDSAF
jgi:hypothetical protein